MVVKMQNLFVRVSFGCHLCRTYLTETGTMTPAVADELKVES